MSHCRRLGVLFKHPVATLSAILAVSVLVAACTSSNDDESASPAVTPTVTAVTQDVVTSEVAESEQVNDQGVFVRVIAPLD